MAGTATARGSTANKPPGGLPAPRASGGALPPPQKAQMHLGGQYLPRRCPVDPRGDPAQHRVLGEKEIVAARRTKLESDP